MTDLVTRPGWPRRDWTVTLYQGDTIVQRMVAHSLPLLRAIVDRSLGNFDFRVEAGMPADHECGGFCGGLPGGRASGPDRDSAGVWAEERE
jgi:hypothetical protein